MSNTEKYKGGEKSNKSPKSHCWELTNINTDEHDCRPYSVCEIDTGKGNYRKKYFNKDSVLCILLLIKSIHLHVAWF